VLGLDHNLAALLAHFTPLSLVWVLAEEKEPNNRWLRFISFQALFAGVAYSILATVLSIVASILGSIVGILGTIVSLLVSLAGLGYLVFMVLTGLKAHKGETPRLPVVSKFAAKYA
jgi:uncharacterized membrane protein